MKHFHLTAQIVSAAFLTFCAHTVTAASFPCNKAQSRIEKSICADAELSRLDDLLGSFYQGAQQHLAQGASCLQSDQKQWLKTTRNVCADNACLKKVYLDRLGELNAIQPGINEVRDMVLPTRSMLVWAIPPAEDTVAAPKLDSKPFRTNGVLGYDSFQGGYLIRSGNGPSYVLVLDMFLEGATAAALTALKEKSVKLTVSGYLAKDTSGQAFFDSRHCVFVYRMP